ncbi:hypothetical protein EAM_2046 [Erwinia amylovora ATCC 49946]|nr:hypothetical protein EAM_2046 [Erwinia amylovora ATCC 49946]
MRRRGHRSSYTQRVALTQRDEDSISANVRNQFPEACYNSSPFVTPRHHFPYRLVLVVIRVLLLFKLIGKL